MSTASQPRLSADVSRSEVFTARTSRRRCPRAVRQLPLHVPPLPEEALISWPLRLATRLGVSMQALEQEGVGIDSRGGRTHWWRRPHAWVLKRISDATGVKIDRLRQMTLHDWSVHADDEASDRFNERHFAACQPEWRVFHYVACKQCLTADAVWYLRLAWTIDWLAICPKHGRGCPLTSGVVHATAFFVRENTCGKALLSRSRPLCFLNS